jgi:hypothetical protein
MHDPLQWLHLGKPADRLSQSFERWPDQGTYDDLHRIAPTTVPARESDPARVSDQS